MSRNTPRQSTSRRKRKVAKLDGPSRGFTNVDADNPDVDRRTIEDKNSNASAFLSHPTPGPTPSSSSNPPVPPPVLGYWNNGQLQLTQTWEGFLSIIPPDGNTTYLGISSVKGPRTDPGLGQPVVYTQQSLEEAWNCEDARPMIVIGVRTPEEAKAFQQQFTLSEIWNLQRTDPGASSQVLGKRKREDEDAMRRRHEKESKVLDVDQMINKTNMLQCYRLEGPYLEAVPEPHEGTFYLSGKGITVPTKLYWERDIEFLAWRMNDGPEGFVRFLYRAYEHWRTKLKKRESEKDKFPIPSSYEGHFMIVWNTKKPGESLDPLIKFMGPVKSPVLKTPLSTTESESRGEKRKSKGPKAKKAKAKAPPPPPPSQRRRSSPVSGPSSRSSM